MTRARTLKVRVTVTVEIDADAWTANYGTEGPELREDVKLYVTNLVDEQLASVGVLAAR